MGGGRAGGDVPMWVGGGSPSEQVETGQARRHMACD